MLNQRVVRVGLRLGSQSTDNTNLWGHGFELLFLGHSHATILGTPNVFRVFPSRLPLADTPADTPKRLKFELLQAWSTSTNLHSNLPTLPAFPLPGSGSGGGFGLVSGWEVRPWRTARVAGRQGDADSGGVALLFRSRLMIAAKP